jgi:hypothetical protein
MARKVVYAADLMAHDSTTEVSDSRERHAIEIR